MALSNPLPYPYVPPLYNCAISYTLNPISNTIVVHNSALDKIYVVVVVGAIACVCPCCQTLPTLSFVSQKYRLMANCYFLMVNTAPKKLTVPVP